MDTSCKSWGIKVLGPGESCVPAGTILVVPEKHTCGFVPEAPPSNLELPFISGVPEVGNELTAIPGLWSTASPLTFTYQWRIDGVDIPGATNSTYTPVPADAGKNLTVVVSASNGGGSTSATSLAVAVVTEPVNVTLPTISGTPEVGQILTGTDGTWTGTPPIGFMRQWYVDGVAVPGETSSTYTIVTADEGKPITFRVTASNTYGSTVATSAPVVVVFAPVNTVAPSITGTTAVGQTLTANNGTWIGTAPITYAHQWTRNGVDIVGATASTYLLTITDDATQIRVRVTATNAQGSANATSAAVLIGTAPSNTALPVITGTPVQGQTLTASNGSWTGTAPITFTRQWKRNGVNIGGATNTTYVVQAADVGQNITVTVTGTNITGSSNATSTATAIAVAPANTVAPSISGTPQVGQTLTANPGTWTGTAPITYTYKWKRNGVDIPGATGSTYVAQVADVD